jgi:hypothetical protein
VGRAALLVPLICILICWRRAPWGTACLEEVAFVMSNENKKIWDCGNEEGRKSMAGRMNDRSEGLEAGSWGLC